MSDVNSAATDVFAECVEKIEAGYEFMLAYAAQGREGESSGGGSAPAIRDFLTDLKNGLEQINMGAEQRISALSDAGEALQAFARQLDEDATKALRAVNLVLSVPSMSSQLIDNLNASAHVRCLLTDVFVLDEALKSLEAANKAG